MSTIQMVISSLFIVGAKLVMVSLLIVDEWRSRLPGIEPRQSACVFLRNWQIKQGHNAFAKQRPIPAHRWNPVPILRRTVVRQNRYRQAECLPVARLR